MLESSLAQPQKYRETKTQRLYACRICLFFVENCCKQNCRIVFPVLIQTLASIVLVLSKITGSYESPRANTGDAVS